MPARLALLRVASALGGVEAAKAALLGKLRENGITGKASAALMNVISGELLKINDGTGKKRRERQHYQETERGITIGLPCWVAAFENKSSRPEAMDWNTDTLKISVASGGGFLEITYSGVYFIESEISALLPSGERRTDGRIASGAPRSADWIPWTAEVAAAVFVGELTPDMTVARATAIIAERLTSQRLISLSDETVRPMMTKVLARLREVR